MAGKNPVAYAEGTLGVHQVHTDVLAAQDAYEACARLLEAQRSEKRQLEVELDDRHTYLAVTVVADMESGASMAARDRAVKNAQGTDAESKRLRGEIEEISYKVSESESNLRALKMRVEIGCARMVELGGYLHYLAAVKQAATAATPAPAAGPWD